MLCRVRSQSEGFGRTVKFGGEATAGLLVEAPAMDLNTVRDVLGEPAIVARTMRISITECIYE